MTSAETESANEATFRRICDSETILKDVSSAGKVIPGMRRDTLVCAGPPMPPDELPGPTRGAAMGALIHEGIAESPGHASKLLAAGEVKFLHAHDHDSIAPMAGIISWSMPVFVVENSSYGHICYTNINEGVGKTKTLRFGAYSGEVLRRLDWMEETLAPALRDALRLSGGIQLGSIVAEALRRGDECHNRNKAATALFLTRVAPHLARSGCSGEGLAKILEFIGGNDHFFLNLSMASAKATMDAAHGIPHSTIVTAMSANGRDFGIRISGLGRATPPYRWFLAPAPRGRARYFEGYGDADACPLLGDSFITECIGAGAFAMVAAPAITEFVGGNMAWAKRAMERMYKITAGEHDKLLIPYLDYRGTPTGIDVRKVLATGTSPIINAGIAHRNPGIGQIGAGLFHAPLQCFREAAKALN
jgi:hypothetical protein